MKKRFSYGRRSLSTMSGSNHREMRFDMMGDVCCCMMVLMIKGVGNRLVIMLSLFDFGRFSSIPVGSFSLLAGE